MSSGGGARDDGPDGADREAAATRRLRGFGGHLLAYFGVMVVLVPVNYAVSPENPWFVLPMVGWGSVLAVHAAYAMGLFKALSVRRR